MKNFDFEIQIRSWVMGALLALLVGRNWVSGETELALVGAFIGALYDFLAFKVKQGLKLGGGTAALILGCLLFAPAMAPAQSISGAYLVDLRDGRARQVVLTTITKIDRPLNLDFSLDVDAFVGLNRGDALYPGSWISAKFDLARNLTVKLGPAFTLEDQVFRSPGMIIGFELRF